MPNFQPRLKKKQPRLPNEIIALPNADKGFHEKWTDTRNKINIPHPFRCVALGPPNSGKGTVVKNILLRADPPFEDVVCVHCDPDYTQEWAEIDAQMLSEIPSPAEWQGLVKTLVILDDLNYTRMGKEQLRSLDRLFGFVSTHKNISVILCSQDAFSVPPCVRRCSNLFVLWRSPDLDSMSAVARKTGLSAAQLHSIFNQLMPDIHDSLWVDLTTRSPFPLRKNGFEIISKSEGSASKKKNATLDTFSTAQ